MPKETIIRPTEYYLCFTLNHDKEDAVERFIKKFGEPPEIVLEDNTMLWVGPVKGEVNAD